MADLISKTTLGERFERAVTYALHVHAAQRRKMSGVPYSAHLLGVCAIALEFGATETEAIAALLHDAVEDCGGRDQLEAIRLRFGDDVAEIVEGCTDSFETDGVKEAWYGRKVRYVGSLGAHANAGDSILLVSACDKLYNVLAIYNDFLRVGPAVFDRFNARRFGTLWYYRSLADAFASVPGRQREIATRITGIVDMLAGEKCSLEVLLRSFETDPTVSDREKGALLKKTAALSAS
jgi:(p)ppGpp synthase/HD superfamily hydrolase